ncbi:MAG: phosphotransferase family protein [Caldilineaceae bacterium]|nr:phosphotransferase family protein [Caldilineaceae bacterium]
MSRAAEAQKLEQVVQKIEPRGKLLRAWRLKGGISAQMTALEVRLADGQTKTIIVRRPGALAVQQNPHAAADEFKILQIVQSAGVRAQTPYYLDQSGEIFPEPYLVIEYIEGQPEYAPANVKGCVFQIAAQLAKIHSVDDSRADLSFLPKQAERFVNQFREQPAELDHSLDEGRIRERLASVWPLPEVNRPVLLHGDFWPGNLLWKADKIAAVIDWEDAALGNPLVDFAISRLDLLWIYGVEAQQEFTRHYQSMTPFDFSNLPYWDLYAALRPASRIGQWAEGWAALGRADITEATMRAGHRLFVAQAFEKLEKSYS